jgi:hypothetical protein
LSVLLQRKRLPGPVGAVVQMLAQQEGDVASMPCKKMHLFRGFLIFHLHLSPFIHHQHRHHHHHHNIIIIIISISISINGKYT